MPADPSDWFVFVAVCGAVLLAFAVAALFIIIQIGGPDDAH